VGFRRVEMRGRQLLVNGKAVLLKGVNRHEHDDRRGKAVTEQGMLADVLLMKRLNFNAVRCSHYPNATRWWVWPPFLRGNLICTIKAFRVFDVYETKSN
jgi:beta-galactosidase